MAQGRYLSLFFSHLMTDWLTRQRPALNDKTFVFSIQQQNRPVVSFASAAAAAKGIRAGMVIGDARLMIPDLEVVAEAPELDRLLYRIALRFDRYSPVVAVDAPDGLLIDITGCAHLWGGEAPYYEEIINRIRTGGYHVRGAIADTPGAAWAFARFSRQQIVPPGQHLTLLPKLSPMALRLPPPTLGLLRRLGFSTTQVILNQPRVSLTPRFGKELLLRL